MPGRAARPEHVGSARCTAVGAVQVRAARTRADVMSSVPEARSGRRERLLPAGSRSGGAVTGRGARGVRGGDLKGGQRRAGI